MKFVTIGDPHFKLDNLSEVVDFIQQTDKALSEIKDLDFIVCLGDLLHTHARINSMPMNHAYSFIKMLSEHAFTYLLVGNHDMINNSQFLSQEHWMNGMKQWKNVKIVDTGHVDEKYNCSFLPYVPPGRFEEALNIVDKDWEKRDCIFAHQEFKGAKMGAIVSEIGDEWKLTSPYVISGHIHDKHKPQDNIFYVGSAMQHSFGESPKKGLHLFEFLNGEWKEKEINLNIVERKIIYLDTENIGKTIEELKQKGKLEIGNEKKKYKLSFNGNVHEYKMFQRSEEYKELDKNGVKFVFKHEKNTKDKENKKSVILSFKETLLDLIKKEKDDKLYALTVSILKD